ncbi:MAG: restriction endonuclease [Patescibacteria group bacterium]
MPRRRRETMEFDGAALITGILVLGLVYVALIFFTDRDKFYQLLAVGLFVLVLLVIGWFYWRSLARKKTQQLMQKIRDLNLELEVRNFIARFGHEKGSKDETWRYRDYQFKLARLADLRKIFSNAGLARLSDDKLHHILEYYIDERELALTMGSIKTEVNKFAGLSGSEFEVLLQRLFVAAGYQVQLIGQPGDQGGDLVANKNGRRLLIQAKRYTGSVGNKAVQEAVAAMAHYDCHEAAVVTTSEFTREAVELAKSNSVKLLGKERLQELLLEHLKESWV